MKMTQSVWLFFTWKVTLKICIYIYTRFPAHIIYISKFCTNFGKPLPRVFTNKQNVNKTWNRKIERGNTLSYWVNSSYIIQETSSLKPTFLREMKSIKILLCLNFLLKFFFLNCTDVCFLSQSSFKAIFKRNQWNWFFKNCPKTWLEQEINCFFR